jgi:hypothetical protein
MHFCSNPIGNSHGPLRVQFRKKRMELKMFLMLLNKQLFCSLKIRRCSMLCWTKCWAGKSPTYTVRKMDLILRPIERRPQMQFSMARRFKLQLLRRYSVKFSKMRNFTLETLRLDKLKSTGGRRTNIPWIYSP